jgi:hypothetical protein
VALPRDRLWECASKLLDTVANYYREKEEPLPARRFVSPGLPSWECEQVTAYVERTYSGEALDTEGTGLVDCLVMRHAVIVIEIARCAPMTDMTLDQPQIPTVGDEEESARAVLADPMLIVNAAVQAYRAGDLAGCRGLAIVDWEALGPESGLAGGRQRFRWQLTEG